eukprot:13689574-Heterocapsa_arctica.AAC.1
MYREGSGFARSAMSFLKADEVMSGNKITEVQVGRPVFVFHRRGKEGLAVPGCALKFACKRGARRAVKRVRRFGGDGTRR